MSINGITGEEYEYFEIDVEESSVMNIKSHPAPILQFDYALSMDRKHYMRSSYTAFNIMGDIGGLYVILFNLSIAILSIANFQRSENLLTAELYKLATDRSEDEAESNHFD